MTRGDTQNLIRLALLVSASAPNVAPGRIATILLDIHSASQSLHRFAETACDRNMTDAECKREKSLMGKVRRLAFEIGIVDVEFNGDPRGYAVKVKLPGGQSNDFGGERWGIG